MDLELVKTILVGFAVLSFTVSAVFSMIAIYLLTRR